MTKHWRLALIGFPLDHSLSPQLHRAALAEAGLEGDYYLLPTPPFPEGSRSIREIIDALRAGEWDGLNITIPHKRSVLPYLNQISKTAAAVGAVNTLIRNSGELIGDNTDAGGFLADTEHMILPKAGTAIVLGAGGAARAAAYALGTKGWKVVLGARRVEQAEVVALELNKVSPGLGIEANQLDLLGKSTSGCDLVINATPVGMHPESDQSPWPSDVPWPQGASAYDMVYNPLETQFLRDARAAGIPARGGIGMLVEQAALAFEAWTGFDPSRSAMTAALEL